MRCEVLYIRRIHAGPRRVLAGRVWHCSFGTYCTVPAVQVVAVPSTRTFKATRFRVYEVQRSAFSVAKESQDQETVQMKACDHDGMPT